MKKNNCLCGFFIAICLIIFSATVCNAQTNSDSNDLTLSPYFFIESENTSIDSFPLKETDVRANIVGIIADIYVVQTYANEGSSPINAKYVFPASTKASVHGMKMEIGDNIVIAEIKEREEARQDFENAQREGKSASLLEQERPNVFTMNVANIMPGDVVRIELHYTELIVPIDGVYEFVFPTVVGPRYSNQLANGTDQWITSPYLHEGDIPPGGYNITVNLSTGVSISGLNSKSHNVNISQESESTAQVTLANPEEFAGNRDYILEYKLTRQEINIGLVLHEGETENFFMLTVQPPERVVPEAIPPREYIFVLDVSGSMYGFSIDTAKELIKNLITNIRETDTFNIILFSGASLKMSAVSVAATEANMKSAFEFIDGISAGGGTELASALNNAVSVPVNDNVSRSVIIITDGYISAEKETFEIIDNNLNNTSFFRLA